MFLFFSDDNLLDTFAAQSKLLIDLTEQIWDCLNSRNYLTATQLFQLALCVKTSKHNIKCLNKIYFKISFDMS